MTTGIREPRDTLDARPTSSLSEALLFDAYRNTAVDDRREPAVDVDEAEEPPIGS